MNGLLGVLGCLLVGGGVGGLLLWLEGRLSERARRRSPVLQRRHIGRHADPPAVPSRPPLRRTYRGTPAEIAGAYLRDLGWTDRVTTTDHRGSRA